MTIRLKRAYAAAEPGDGTRVLVDGLWPRGVSKAAAKIDVWLKEVAPTAALRKWFAHDPKKWDQFRARYGRELDDNPAPVDQLRALARAGTVTLVTATKDEEHNHAVVLLDYLGRAGGQKPRPRKGGGR